MKKHLTIVLFLAGAAFFLACQKINNHPPAEQIDEIKSEAIPNDCGQLRTQTQGGWGANPSGGNPGTYLHSNFAAAFPAGLRVGCTTGNFTITYTFAQDVTEFLPAGGTAAAQTANAINPKFKSIKNVLIGQVTALALSVGFDYYDPNFGPSDVNLGDMVITNGIFTGKSVSQFLEIANNVLGGCSQEYTPSQVNETATLINENFDDGTTDNNFLSCSSTRRVVRFF